MNKQAQKNHNPKENPCHICGSQEFIWGRSVGAGEDLIVTSWLYFRADKGSWGDGEKLRARKCNKCDNVQLFADFAKEKAARKAAYKNSSGIVV